MSTLICLLVEVTLFSTRQWLISWYVDFSFLRQNWYVDNDNKKNHVIKTWVVMVFYNSVISNILIMRS